MRIVAPIPVSAIVVDRLPMQRTLALVDYLRAGGEVPPIHVKTEPHGRYRILDGRHRILAYKLLGRDKIVARWGVR